MSDVRGYGRYLGSIAPAAALYANPGLFPADNAAPLLADWMLQPGPPAPVEIPYAWLDGTQPLRVRHDKPLTSASVTIDGGATAIAQSADSLAAYGDAEFDATLYSATPGDGPTLADWAIAYYATDPAAVPRARFPALRLLLIGRTQPEMHRILGVGIGTRITITDTPPSWPVGATEQVVEGIRHTLNETRAVEWTTAPVIGSAPGTAGPWFRLDVLSAGTDILF